MKRCSVSLDIREVQIKTAMREKKKEEEENCNEIALHTQQDGCNQEITNIGEFIEKLVPS